MTPEDPAKRGFVWSRRMTRQKPHDARLEPVSTSVKSDGSAPVLRSSMITTARRKVAPEELKELTEK